MKNSPDYVPSIFNHKETDSQSSQASLMRYERLQRQRLDQSLSAPVSEPQATCEPQASSGYAESTSSFGTSEATGSSGSQAMPDGELEDEETCDTVSEADDVVTEDVIEVVNLDFSDDFSNETIANTAVKESNRFSTDAVNGPPGSSTIPPVVDQEILCGSNTTVDKAVCQFGVDITRVSKIFNHWINIMHVELQPLIRWPERDMLRKTLPACFKPQYS